MVRKLTVSTALLLTFGICGGVWAGEVTVGGALVVDEGSGNALFPNVLFFNGNDVSVDLKFVILQMDVTSPACVNPLATYPDCSNPSGEIDEFEAIEGGLQTVTIPALSQFALSPLEFKPDELAFTEDISGAQFYIQASWQDHVLATDGSMRSITPIKAFVHNLTFHFSGEAPDAVLGCGTYTPYK